MKQDYVTSADGTKLSYKIIGNGPGLLIIHGGFLASQHYQQLAELLSDTFTVYLLDRRGRNGSGPKGNNYSIQTECEDAMAILHKHNTTYLFGHSFGGFVALNTALRHPLTKLAVYEPGGIARNSAISMDWLPQLETEVKHQDYGEAIITFLKGVNTGGLFKLPRPILKLLFRSMKKRADWPETINLIKELPAELSLAMQFEQPLEAYQQITAKTLLLTGSKSPDYLTFDSRCLETVLTNGQSVNLPGLDHSAPYAKGAKQVAQALKSFFS